jgi:lysophospholipase L1-like esterase
MNIRKFFFPIYLVLVVGGILLISELVSMQINHKRGIELPFFIGSGGAVGSFRGDERFSVLDPHLGYGRGEREPSVEEFQSRYNWHRGFAIYSDKPLDQLDRPLILTLGGSTTDPLNHETSWPEELSQLLSERGISGTVVNGAAGGYSTNQELLKLIRDGIEFRPDLVISYSAVNDRGVYGPLPYPMVHRYQRELLANITQSNLLPLLPNTISVLKSIGSDGEDNQLRYTLGLETQRNLGEWYARNLMLMNAVAQAGGAEFLGVIQPNAYVGHYEWQARYEDDGKPKEYIDALRALYEQISDLPASAGYVHSFIEIFDGTDGVYKNDGVHTLKKGDRIVAENMLALIEKETSLLQSAAAQHK